MAPDSLGLSADSTVEGRVLEKASFVNGDKSKDPTLRLTGENVG